MNTENTKTQQLMNEVYGFWQLDENRRSEETRNFGDKNEILSLFSEAHEAAVRFGNFNYQVHNGGIAQWISNQYMKEDIDGLLDICDKVDELKLEGFEKISHAIRRVHELMKDHVEETNEECSTCGGEREITYYDLDEVAFVDEDMEQEFEENGGEITLSCDQCGGTGEVTVHNEYPSEILTLEKEYCNLGEEKIFDLFDQILTYFLEEEKSTWKQETMKLNRGTVAKMYAKVSPHTQTLHLFDLDEMETTSLTNAIGELYEQIEKSYSFKHLYLYHTDGLISEYKDGSFTHVPEEDKCIYRPFLLKLEGRKVA